MNRLLVGLTVFVAFATAGCKHAPGPAPATSDAMASRELQKVSDEFWDYNMRVSPISATYFGDRRFDDQLPDLTPKGKSQELDQARFLYDQAKTIDPNGLSAQDRLTRSMLMSMLEGTLATEVCKSHWWDVNALNGVQTQLGELPELHGISTGDQAEALVTRYRKAGDFLDQHISNLRTGHKEGYSAAKVAVARVIAQLDSILKEPAESSPLVTGVRLPESFDAAKKQELTGKLVAAVKESVLPGMQRYRDFLQNEYLPHARDEVGVEKNKNGAECYRAQVLAQTHLELSPSEIHKVGLEQAEQNLRDMQAIAKKLTGKEDLEALKAHLAKDPAQQLKSREHVLEVMNGLMKKADAKMPELFGTLPRQKVQVKPIEAFREASSPMGYYYAGSELELRPGYFYVNTSGFEGQAVYLFESLAFHEAVPGHHLQGAIAQEVEGMPRFRRELGDAAFAEGWAHYAELLMDEHGMYSSDGARFGMLSDQSLRAVRLVVDTGMHHLGWSRQKALEYMLTHTAEPRDSAEREIDRYIVWPGQALSYKLGQLEILRLRAEAKQKLGERFDLRRFHDALLVNGALPLPVLREAMGEWLAAELAAARK